MKKAKSLQIRLTDEEHAMVESMVAIFGSNNSEAVRRCIRYYNDFAIPEERLKREIGLHAYYQGKADRIEQDLNADLGRLYVNIGTYNKAVGN